MMFKGALRSDQEWDAFHKLIETLGDDDVDRAADESRSRRLVLAAPTKQDVDARQSSEVRANKDPEGSAGHKAPLEGARKRRDSVEDVTVGPTPSVSVESGAVKGAPGAPCPAKGGHGV